MRNTKLNVPASQLPLGKEPADFRSSMHWRIFRIMAELLDGWQFLADYRNNVAVFGSSRVSQTHPWYLQALHFSEKLANNGFTVITEGGPGIMQAANQGASQAKAKNKGESVGFNIKLEHQSRVNPYVKKGVDFHYFFVRNLMMSYSSRAYVFFPGGLGTLDNLTGIITLMQTKKITRTPIILISSEFWDPVNRWIKRSMLDKFHAINPEDMDLYTIVDKLDDAIEIIKNSPIRNEF
jgi:uncharacterized protein (TIGR00730 family)